MTDTNKTSGADVLVSFNVMIDLAKAHLCRADIGDAAKEIFRVEIQDAEKAWQAVAALIGREAAQSAWLELLEDVCERLKSELRTANKSETALVKEVEALAAEVEALREFSRWVISESSFAGNDIDGGSVQDKAEALGLIIPAQVTEPCGEYCLCAEVEMPATCYRFSANMSRASSATGVVDG